jgi:hypothetical protein
MNGRNAIGKRTVGINAHINEGAKSYNVPNDAQQLHALLAIL